MAFLTALLGLVVKNITQKVALSFVGKAIGRKLAGKVIQKAFTKKFSTKMSKWYMQTFNKLWKNYPKAYQKIKPWLGAYQNTKKMYAFMSNPNLIQLFLKNIPTKKVLEFEKTIIKVEKLIEKSTISELKKKLNKELYKEKIDTLNDELNGKGKWTDLSSSWIKKGKWELSNKNKNLGYLWIQTIKNNNIYIYPAVSYEIWVLMKNSNGSNGGGAGTYFWKYFLHEWYPSALKSKINKDLKRGKITQKEHIDIYREVIQNSTNNFYKNKSKKALNSPNLGVNWYKNRSGKGKIANIKKSTKLLDKQNSTTYIQISKNKKEFIGYNINPIKKIKTKKIDNLYGSIKKSKNKIKKNINKIVK